MLANFCSDCGRKLVIDQYGFSMGCDADSCVREKNRRTIRDLKTRVGTKEEVKVEVKYEPLVGGLRHDEQGGHKILTRSQWPYEQKALVKELVKHDIIKGDILNNTDVLIPTDICRHVNSLGKRCTSKAESHSREINLCTEHKLERRREQVKQAVRRFRAKSNQ